MLGKANFTSSRIAALGCESGKKQSIHWDGKTPGLGLRVTAAGAKSFIFETRLHGKTIRVTIGDVRTWTISAAQAEATRLKSLTDQGIDPRQQDAEKRERAEKARALELRKASKVADAWTAYVEQHKRHWGARHLADHANLSQAGGEDKIRGKGKTVQGVLYPLLSMRMVDVNASRLQTWQAEEALARPNNARQGFELFRAFWRWCAERDEYKDIIERDAVESSDLRKKVPARNNKRMDVLERGHLPNWFQAVRGLSNPVVSAYLQALILTGARREEMAELKWTDVDFKWNSLWIKDKVAAEGRKVPLTPYIASLLQNLKRINETPPKVRKIRGQDDEALKNWKPSAWVFSSRSAASGYVSEPRIAHDRALSAAGIPHVTLHGLRRTFASLAEWVEMPRGIVAQIMGHKPNATAEKHYINRPLDLLAVWHGKYEAWILAQAGVAFEARDGTGLRAVA
jgi:integrase